MTDTGPTRAVTVEHLPPMTHRRERLVGPDVVRAVALIGVVVMNYHGYLNGADAVAGPDAGFAERLFDPWTGVLATRFAATFMFVAGVGISLLTERSRTSGDRLAIRDDRWRLVRRGLLLYGGGFLLDWIWPGTILFFYGATFVVAALLFTLRTRWLVVTAVISTVSAAAINAWAVDRMLDGRPATWLTSPDTLGTTSPRGLLFDTFVNGTHPLLPWLAFCCAGMVLGRMVPHGRRLLVLASIGAGVTAATYLVGHVARSGRTGDVAWAEAWSTRPFDRGVLYTVGATGTALAAFALLSWLAERRPDHPAVGVLRAAGEMTLTLYLGHVAVYLLLVDVLGAVGRDGLGTALAFAVGYWVLALAFAVWWRRFVGMGPVERIYRRLGG